MTEIPVEKVMRLYDWYSQKKSYLEKEGFELKFFESEESQSLQATGSNICFDFIEWGRKFADYGIISFDGKIDEMGRIDDLEDIPAYFEGIFSEKILPLLAKDS